MYYAVIDACPTCGHGEKHAICKSLRTFRAYLSSDPWGVPVTSWADWKTVLSRPNVGIVDEYGDRYYISEFATYVEKAGPQRFPSHAPLPVYASWEAMIASGNDWESFVDAEGYVFYARDFT